MVTRLPTKRTPVAPVVEVRELRTESDVEQKVILPFLQNASYLGLRSGWIRTKEYMSPTEIDKAAGKRYGYVPDYSIWINSIPLLITEAKAPDVAIQVALREARLYAGEVNKRYPPEVNPIGHVLACNGVEVALSTWDSEVNTPSLLFAPTSNPERPSLQLFKKPLVATRSRSAHKSWVRIFRRVRSIVWRRSWAGGLAWVSSLG